MWKQILELAKRLFMLAEGTKRNRDEIRERREEVRRRRLSDWHKKGILLFVMNNIKAYEEIVDFIAAGTTPQNVISFRPSEAAQERVADLLVREKERELSPAEKSELDHYLQLEHLMRLAKARARDFLPNE